MSDALPPMVPRTRIVTARDVAMAAAASRDWQPQHHDVAYAQGMKLPDIIMNAPTQTGWFHAYAMNWAGPDARIARWRLTMRRPICPGAEVTYSGVVIRQESDGHDGKWLWLDLRCNIADATHSFMVILLSKAHICGGIMTNHSANLWNPPPLD